MNTISTLMRHLAERNGIDLEPTSSEQTMAEQVAELRRQNEELMEALELLLSGATEAEDE